MSPSDFGHGRVLVETLEAHAALAAQLVAQALCRRLEVAASVSLFLSGGSTPRETFRRLAGIRLAWQCVDFFWGDERCVPAGDPRSNFELARRELLEAVAVPETAVHRIPAELGARAAARQYERVLRRQLGPGGGRPDVVLLGLGEDGHTASLFPFEGGVDRSEALVVAVEVPRPPRQRITLTKEILTAARETFFLVTGEAKAAIVSRILSGEENGPAAEIARRSRRVTWVLDEAAARGVE